MNDVVIVGGPSGVGKSTFIQKLNKVNFKIYDLDSYRLYYPNYVILMREKPISINKITSKFAGNLMNKDIVNSLKNHENFILECTFSSLDNTLEEIIQNNYQVNLEVYLIIASFEEVILSIYERYMKSFNILGYGRIITLELLKEKYDFFKSYIKQIVNYDINSQIYYRELEEFKRINLNDIDLIKYKNNNFDSRLRNIENFICNIKNIELQNELIKVKKYLRRNLI